MIHLKPAHRALQQAARIVLSGAALATSIACSGQSDSPPSPDAQGGSAGSGLGSSGATSGGGAGLLAGMGSGGASAGTAGNAEQSGLGGTSGSTGDPNGNVAGNGGSVAGTGGNGAEGGTGGTSGGASGSAGSAGAANLPKLSVYIAGDSTVSQYVLDPNNPKSWAGWGQMLSPHYDARVMVVDAAVGGRTARRFIQEGSLAAILTKIQAGDYLLVQFGTNDSNESSTYTLNGTTYPYFAAAETDFKTYMQQYVDGAVAKKAIPVFVTPPPRNSAYCMGPRSLANYGQAMIELGQKDAVKVVDLGLRTHDYLSAICPKPTTGSAEQFFKVNADNTIDGTHFQENGARIMAGFVADGIRQAQLGLDAYRKP